jgi:hypothetical protein
VIDPGVAEIVDVAADAGPGGVLFTAKSPMAKSLLSIETVTDVIWLPPVP